MVYETPPEFVIETTADGFGFADRAKIGFANDTRDANAAFMRDSQVPTNMSASGRGLHQQFFATTKRSRNGRF